MKCPCKDCQDRYPACHGSCEKFQIWHEPYKAAQEERQRYYKVEAYVRDGSLRGLKKYRINRWGRKVK